MRQIVNLWGLIVGRPQNFADKVTIQSTKKQRFYIHFSHDLARRTKSEARKPAPSDVLISPIDRPEEFSTVVAAWLKLDDNRQVSRLRLYESFSKQRSYGTERLIGSASMFDLLPDDAIPSENVLEQSFARLLADTRLKFRNAPPSPERDSILSAL